MPGKYATWFLIIVALVLCGASAASADGDGWFGDEKPVYQPREKIVLFEIQTPGLELTEQASVNYFVERELAALAFYDILSGEALAKKLDIGRVPVCTDSDCRTRTANAAEATEYIHGSVKGGSDSAEITVERVRVSDGHVIVRKTYKWEGEPISLPALTAWLAIQLFLPAEALVDGQLQLDVKPRLSKIKADGSEVAVPSDNTIRLEAGVHRMELFQPGYEKKVLPVVIIPKRVNYQRVELKLE